MKPIRRSARFCGSASFLSVIVLCKVLLILIVGKRRDLFLQSECSWLTQNIRNYSGCADKSSDLLFEHYPIISVTPGNRGFINDIPILII